MNKSASLTQGPSTGILTKLIYSPCLLCDTYTTKQTPWNFSYLHNRIEKTLQKCNTKKITIFLESFSTTIKCFSSLVMKSRGWHHHIQQMQLQSCAHPKLDH